MRRYFFHRHGYSNELDLTGQVLADDWDAMKLARSSAREQASADAKDGSIDLNHFVMCVDETERLVGMVRFADVVKVAPLLE